MKQKRSHIQKDILFIFISSFIVVVAWIGFNIYHIYATTTISEEIQLQLTPISPNFDQVTMQQLKTRENIDPFYDSLKASVSVTPQPGQATITPTPTTSLTSSQSTSQSASDASQLAPVNSPINRLGQ